jgi:hypothetical protein
MVAGAYKACEAPSVCGITSTRFADIQVILPAKNGFIDPRRNNLQLRKEIWPL